MQFAEPLAPSVSPEDAPQANTDPHSSPPNFPLHLEFSSDHPLSKLHAFWTGAQASTSSVCLDLFSESSLGVSVSIPDPAQELKRLHIILSHAARTRLDQVFPDGPEGTAAQLETGSLVLLSRDRMIAWLFLFPPTAQGKELTAPELCHILSEHRITRGIHWPLLRRIPSLPHRYFQLFPIACGTPPVPGQDGYILDRYSRLPSEEPPEDDLAQADYVALKLVQDIQEGEPICEIVPPAAGVPGNTVTGDIIPAPEGQAAAVPQGRNTRLSEDGRFLVADRSGHVAFSGRDFQVKPILDLTEEELQEGKSIKFWGDVHIHGDLCGGVSICAMGSVQIDGVVEDCSIEAGEHIIVSSGVQGQDQAVLHAHKSVYAKYLEHCQVYARENVYADCIINCSIHCNRTVQVCTGRGAVVGGRICAAGQVSALTVGSKAERPTHIVLGGHPCEEAERAQILSELETLSRSLEELESQPTDYAGKAELSKLRLNQCVIKMKLDKLDKELEEPSSPGSARESAKLLCGTVYPGTVVTIGHDTFPVTHLQSDCAIGLRNGRVGLL